MHGVVDGQPGERRAMHEPERHRVERDIDCAGVGYHGIGVFGDRPLVERVHHGDAADIANGARDLLGPDGRPSGQYTRVPSPSGSASA